jgi:hypothetical protein
MTSACPATRCQLFLKADHNSEGNDNRLITTTLVVRGAVAPPPLFVMLDMWSSGEVQRTRHRAGMLPSARWELCAVRVQCRAEVSCRPVIGMCLEGGPRRLEICPAQIQSANVPELRPTCCHVTGLLSGVYQICL